MKTFTEPLQTASAGRPSGVEATVLVIDDDPSMHDILAVLGGQHGFGIQFAEDGMDGVRLAEQNDVDLIVLDLNLPGLTGFDVCRRIRSAGIEIPIVMVSASSDPVDVVVGLDTLVAPLASAMGAPVVTIAAYDTSNWSAERARELRLIREFEVADPAPWTVTCHWNRIGRVRGCRSASCIGRHALARISVEQVMAHARPVLAPILAAAVVAR